MQVGETAAFDAVHALAQCLPGALGKHALAISRTLRLIELDKQGNGRAPYASVIWLFEDLREDLKLHLLPS